jgi:AcrR family transcriptional regulator
MTAGQTPTEEGSKGERTRNRLVDAAHRLFVEQGYHGTSMRQIAQRAGLAAGGIYNHFAGKEDLFVAVLMAHHPYREILEVVQTTAGETVEELLRRAAARMLDALGQRADSLHLMFVELVEFEGRHFPQLFELIYPQAMRFVQRVMRAQGTLRPIPPPTVLRAFLGLFFSYFMTEWLMGEQFGPELKEGAFDGFVDIFLHGVLGEKAEEQDAGPETEKRSNLIF